MAKAKRKARVRGAVRKATGKKPTRKKPAKKKPAKKTAARRRPVRKPAVRAAAKKPQPPAPEVPRPRVTKVVPDAVLLSPRHPRLISLAAEVDALERRGEMQAADRSVEIGVRLREARMSLSHGDWATWVGEQTVLNMRAAQRHVLLSLWAQEYPRDYARWRELGPSKLALIVMLDDAQLKALRKVPISRPKSEGPSLATLSVASFKRTVEGLPRKLKAALEREPVERTIDRFEERVRRLNRDVQSLLGERKVDSDQVRSLRELLLEVVAVLKTT